MANCCDFHHHNILSTPQRIGIAPPVRREHSAHSLVAYRCGANRGWLRLGRVIEIPYARPTSIRYYRKPTDLDERSGRSSPIISLQRALGRQPNHTLCTKNFACEQIQKCFHANESLNFCWAGCHTGLRPHSICNH